ncbi:MAG TPA: SDR family NAD(P)-dependent oxidoreductase [Stellaceae bacterium]|nr:SDR family NAD(P)-dependent oxidoreductase [Stellaceae bacterium]
MAETVAIVTGASAGIGRATALGLARAGMRVVMTGRNAARTEAARRFVAENSGSQQVTTALADFTSLAQIRRLAGELLEAHPRIDVLVNNAGLIAPKHQSSADGYELTMAVNHLASFLLTGLLLDRLKASAEPSSPGRIVTVASEAHRGARIDPAQLAHPQDWSTYKAYGRSKLCNILFTRELAARLGQNSGVVATCLHPGVVATELGDRSGGLIGLGWRLGKMFMISPERGAETSIFLATVPDPERFHGAYVVRKEVAQPSPEARNDDLARRLWEESARLVGS